jgi:protoheme IX farnesyltransferase
MREVDAGRGRLIDAGARSGIAAEYAALAKPGLTVMSVCTAAGGAYLATGGHPPALLLVHLIIGTLLVGSGAGALNQWIERFADARMKRTERRPLPSGALSAHQALAFGLVCALGGVVELTYATTVLAGILASVTLFVYLLMYTPLKRITHLSTAVGGIPGALPPLIGWVAAGRGMSLEGYLLFLFLFFWQMPHFLSLAWMYRHDYARGGYHLLPLYDPSGAVTGRLVVLYTAALPVVGVSLSVVGLMGWVFLVGSLLAGGAFLLLAVRFERGISNDNARRLFFGSLLYLSVILALMLLDRVTLG